MGTLLLVQVGKLIIRRFADKGENSMPGFYIVSEYGYVLPMPYSSYESAMANCDINELVYLADSLEDLEQSLDFSENME